MTVTVSKLADIIEPTTFADYILEETTKVNAFWRSGIVSPFTPLAPLGQEGTIVHMPFWQDLTGNAQVLDDSTDLDVSKIEAGEDEAVLLGRALVYGATDLAGDIAGDDPMRTLATRYATKWSEETNLVTINALKGATSAMANESPAINTLDISGLSGTAAHFDADAFIDARQQLGDMKSKLTAVAMHSDVEAHLEKNDVIDFIQESEVDVPIPMYQGKRVIVDDELAPASGNVYTTYLFGMGAVGYTEGSPKVPAETEREALKNGGEEYLVSRRHFVYHPRGIKWDPAGGVPSKKTPSNAELADAGNWSRVYNGKNIRIVRFVHKIAS